MNDSLLKAHNLSYCHDSKWNLDIDIFNLYAGEFVGITGPNGAGKSTFLRLLSGMILPASGNIEIYGKRLQQYDRISLARIIGYLPQENFSQFDITVYDLVALGRYPHKKGFSALSAADKNTIQKSLHMCEIEKLQNRALSQLSGGERKRAFLASVLAQEPKILLLDEPVASLDIHHQTNFFKLLKKLCASDIAIAAVTHELNLASLFCSRMLILDNGRISHNGDASEIIYPEMIKTIYGNSVGVFAHPQTSRPIVLPLKDNKE